MPSLSIHKVKSVAIVRSSHKDLKHVYDLIIRHDDEHIGDRDQEFQLTLFGLWGQEPPVKFYLPPELVPVKEEVDES